MFIFDPTWWRFIFEPTWWRFIFEPYLMKVYLWA
jgi:hypothetical protein